MVSNFVLIAQSAAMETHMGRGLDRGVRLERGTGSGVPERGVGSTAQQLRLRDTMLADLRSQNKALAGEAYNPPHSGLVPLNSLWHALCSMLLVEATHDQADGILHICKPADGSVLTAGQLRKACPQFCLLQ